MLRRFSALRKTRVGSHDREVATSRRSKRNLASRKVRVAEQVRSQIARLIAYVSYLSVVLLRRDVTNQPMQFTIAFGRPPCDKTSEVANSFKQIKPGHSGSVEDFHQHLGRQGLKNSTICLVLDL